MPTHIDQVVTDVVQQPESGEAREQEDTRWQDEAKFKQMSSRCDRLQQRLSAEGFDD